MPLRPRALPSVLGVTLTAVAACAAPSAAPSVVGVGAPSPSGSVYLASPPELPRAPGTVRCGVDDEAVPIGDLLPPRRGLRDAERRFPAGMVELPMPSRGLPMEVSLELRGEGLGSADQGLASVFGPCETQATEADSGMISVNVAFAKTGAAYTSSPVQASGAPSLSPYGRCLVERACRLSVPPELAGKTGTVHARTKVAPPVFRGKVDVLVVFGQPPPGMGAPKVSKAQRAKLDAIKAPVEAATLRCARLLPPADDVFFSFQAELRPRGAPGLAMFALDGHAETVRRCLEAGLTTTPPAAPAPTMVTITVHIRAQSGAAAAVDP